MREASIALNRFGLGGRMGEVPPADPRRWLLDQFGRYDPAPPAIKALPGSAQLLPELAEAREGRREREEQEREARQKGMSEEAIAGLTAGQQRLFRELREEYLAAVGARCTAALSTTTPFVERLVHFWSNHFAISVDKVAVIGLAGAFEFEAIRPHVLGKFGDMLMAVERHPTMLLYLDQAQSVGPDSPLATRAARRGRERGLNENLAREILELHTLGVRTVYSQADVTELARALTGWTIGGIGRLKFLSDSDPGFLFAAPLHQPGDRALLGKRYGQQGEAQAAAMLRDLAAHPATARHIATKLARHFAADDPPPELVTRLEQAFLRSGGDLPTVYRALIEAPEPWAATPKFRTPWDWAIGSLRATGTPALPGATAAGAFQQLGQAIWRPGSPAGYDDITASWAGPDALVRRVEVAERIAARAAPLDARALSEALFPGTLSEATRTAIARAESPGQALALLLAAPEMMRR